MERDFKGELQRILGHASLPKDTLKQPAVPLFDVYRRTIAGRSKPLYMGLTQAEALSKAAILNQRELAKRTQARQEAYEKGFEYEPVAIELVYYDIVNQANDEESNPYYNSRPVIKESV